MTRGHTDALLTCTDRVVCNVIEGHIELDAENRERLICAKIAIELMLDGKIVKGMDHMKLWGEISRVGWEKTYGDGV